ncbi:MAG TPA: hypothetical protein VGQ09_02185 [Chitinophagaceae bacterium]|jgi:hypothetical protein|nr:hypothetical protein [Chitinophagaceae bacterium]
MEYVPLSLYFVFGLAALLALIIFYRASQNSRLFLVIALLWIFIQSFLSLSKHNTLTKSLLPIFPMLAAPPSILAVTLLFTKRGKEFIQTINMKMLMMLHFVRVLIELGLFWLSTYKVVPKLLTFEGRNFDILIGLTAPVIYYFGFVKPKLSKSIILAWNVIGLAFLFNVVLNTVLTIPNSDSNFALGYFPFFLLPSLIVPLVMFSHLASIKQILSNK